MEVVDDPNAVNLQRQGRGTEQMSSKRVMSWIVRIVTEEKWNTNSR